MSSHPDADDDDKTPNPQSMTTPGLLATSDFAPSDFGNSPPVPRKRQRGEAEGISQDGEEEGETGEFSDPFARKRLKRDSEQQEQDYEDTGVGENTTALSVRPWEDQLVYDEEKTIQIEGLETVKIRSIPYDLQEATDSTLVYKPGDKEEEQPHTLFLFPPTYRAGPPFHFPELYDFLQVAKELDIPVGPEANVILKYEGPEGREGVPLLPDTFDPKPMVYNSSLYGGEDEDEDEEEEEEEREEGSEDENANGTTIVVEEPAENSLEYGTGDYTLHDPEEEIKRQEKTKRKEHEMEKTKEIRRMQDNAKRHIDEQLKIELEVGDDRSTGASGKMVTKPGDAARIFGRQGSSEKEKQEQEDKEEKEDDNSDEDEDDSIQTRAPRRPRLWESRGRVRQEEAVKENEGDEGNQKSGKNPGLPPAGRREAISDENSDEEDEDEDDGSFSDSQPFKRFNTQLLNKLFPQRPPFRRMRTWAGRQPPELPGCKDDDEQPEGIIAYRYDDYVKLPKYPGFSRLGWDENGQPKREETINENKYDAKVKKEPPAVRREPSDEGDEDAKKEPQKSPDVVEIVEKEPPTSLEVAPTAEGVPQKPPQIVSTAEEQFQNIEHQAQLHGSERLTRAQRRELDAAKTINSANKVPPPRTQSDKPSRTASVSTIEPTKAKGGKKTTKAASQRAVKPLAPVLEEDEEQGEGEESEDENEEMEEEPQPQKGKRKASAKPTARRQPLAKKAATGRSKSTTAKSKAATKPTKVTKKQKKDDPIDLETEGGQNSEPETTNAKGRERGATTTKSKAAVKPEAKKTTIGNKKGNTKSMTATKKKAVPEDQDGDSDDAEEEREDDDPGSESESTGDPPKTAAEDKKSSGEAPTAKMTGGGGRAKRK